MKKKNLRFKSVSKLDDYTIDLMVEEASSYVIGLVDGEPEYHPLFKQRGLKTALVKYLVTGLTFEDGDDIDELIYTDKSINNLFETFVVENNDFYDSFVDYVNEVIEFKKRKLLNYNSSISEKLLEILDTQKTFEDLRLEVLRKENIALEQQIKANKYQEEIMSYMTPEESAELNKKLLSGEYDMDKISESIMKKYLNTDFHNKKTSEIIDSKNTEIVELKKYKQLYEARNVLDRK